MTDPLVIPDEWLSIDASASLYPPEYEGHLSKVMIKHDDILLRVQALAEKIHKDYSGCRPVLICVLKGANQFFQHLCDALMGLKQGFYIEFLRVSSYEGASSTGNVKVGGGLDYKSLSSKHVLLIEDILDTGTTLSHLVPVLQKEVESIRSIKVCTLLDKRLPKAKKHEADYIGFSIPNHFIIGYGLDYNELYRDLKDIWVISQTGIDFDASSLD